MGANWSDNNGNGYFDDGDPIIVMGYVYTAGLSSGAGGVGGGGGLGGLEDDVISITPSTGDETIPAAEPLPTPCVETTFATPNVSLTDANRAALAASNAIKHIGIYQTYEFSSIVFVHNGQVGFTDPYTDLLEDDVNLLGGIGNVPTGAVIIGVVHNHPDQINVDDRFPSPRDWVGYSNIQELSSSGSLPRGITADANTLFYMLSDQNRKTYVYDRTDKNTKSASCSLQ